MEPIPMPGGPLEPSSVDAVILAGGINTRQLYEGYTPGYKALVMLHSRPLIRYVLDAVGASRYVRRIAVVGSEPDLRPVVGPDVAILPAGDTLLGSIVHAFGVFPDSPRMALVTSDLAMLRPHMLDEFIEAAVARPCRFPDRLCLTVVPKDRFTGPFAACGKLFNRFRDVAVCHGNIYLATPSLAHNEKAMARINALYATRKSAIQSALSVGLRLGLAYVIGVHFLHLLTLDRFANMASNRFGFGLVPVGMPYPHLAVDIDEAGDFRVAREVLAAST